MRTINDKRKSARRAMRYTAWVAQQDKELIGCMLADISDTGARLNHETPDSLPDQFVLFLSRSGSPRRKCNVAWRSKRQLGVQFDFPLSARMTAGAVAKMVAAKHAHDVELAVAERERKVAEPADA